MAFREYKDLSPGLQGIIDTVCGGPGHGYLWAVDHFEASKDEVKEFLKEIHATRRMKEFNTSILLFSRAEDALAFWLRFGKS